jgi:hypothetical protein
MMASMYLVHLMVRIEKEKKKSSSPSWTHLIQRSILELVYIQLVHDIPFFISLLREVK